LLEGLNLSDDQKAQIKQIHQDAKAKIQATNADTTLSEDQKQAQYKQIHQATEKQVHMLLTPQQRKQLRAERQARAVARQQQAAPAQQAAPPQNQ
jgi:Spy/CpxP family protein refolding chaperone